MSQPEAATQVRFAQPPVGVPDAVKMIFAGQNDGKLLIKL